MRVDKEAAPGEYRVNQLAKALAGKGGINEVPFDTAGKLVFRELA